MNTKICRLTGTEEDNEIFTEAGRIIRGGGLVAFPTETVYGLGGNALDSEAAQRIYAAKGRPSDNPLILHIASERELAPLVKEVPEIGRRLMERYWPGPMTLIFEKSDLVPAETTGGLNTAAVRMPSHEAARRLIEAAGVPIAAPSANLSGRPSPTSVSHVIEDLDGRVDMIIDGGDVPIGLESTIIDVTGGEAMILRPGYIGVEEVQRVAGSGRLDPAITGVPAADLRPRAPGMKYRHYAPKANITIIRKSNTEADSENRSTDAVSATDKARPTDALSATDKTRPTDAVSTVSACILQLARDKAAQGFRTRIFCCEEHKHLYPEEMRIVVGRLSDGQEIAHNLYRCLREMDEEGVQFVFSEAFDENPLGEAIMNRLTKAAGYHIITAAEQAAFGQEGQQPSKLLPH